MKNKKKVFLLCLDGFGYRVAEEMKSKGIMPNLDSFCRKGVSGVLKSVFPYETAPAWVSFQTGSYPERTGIYTFQRYNAKERKVLLNSYSNIKVPTIFDVFIKNNLKVVSVNLPVTYPAPVVNGVIVPGLLCPKITASTVYPKQIANVLEKKYSGYGIVDLKYKNDFFKFIESQKEIEKKRWKFAKQLLSESDWEVFILQIHGLDVLQHYTWHYVFNQKFNSLEKKERCFSVYKQCDNMIGELSEMLDSKTLTLIVSDHGFTDHKRTFNINKWLLEKGYLKLVEKDTKKNRLKNKFPFIKKLAIIYGKFKKTLKKKRQNVESSEKVLQHLTSAIDFNKSIAFGLGNSGAVLFVNDNIDRDRVIEQIKDLLLQEFGKDTNNALIKSIEIYLGKDIEEPAILIDFKEGCEVNLSLNTDKIVNEVIPDDKLMHSGTHHKEGFWAANGKDVMSDRLYNAKIVDIAPTIYSFLGVETPSSVDGEALKDCFKTILNKKESSHIDIKRKNSNINLKDEELIQKKLNDLGYM